MDLEIGRLEFVISKLLSDTAVEGFKDNRHEIVTLGTFDLFEGLDVFILGAVHDGKNFSNKMRFIPGPLTTRTCVEWLQCFSFVVT